MMSFNPLRLPFLGAALVSQFAAALPASCEVSSGPNQECSAKRDTVLLQKQQVQMKTTAGDSDKTSIGDTSAAVHNCRFATLPEWDALTEPDNTNLQDDYVAAVLRWDGKFASPGAAVSLNGMTRDHIKLDDNGDVERIAGYTAPSKESLHISMLAVVLDEESPLAWNFVIDSALSGSSSNDFSEDELRDMAKAEALRRLTTIIGEYERWRELCPGCGGFLNWIWVDDEGIISQGGEKVKGIPALDNGQMAWAMVAAHQVLLEKGHEELAARYQAQIDVMANSADHLFVHWEGQRKRSASSVNVKEKSKPVGEGKIAQKGMLRDPFEGELMIMFETLMVVGVKDNTEAKKKLWKKVKKGVQVKQYTGPEGVADCLPDGPITVESGWRFSAHEEWKYLVMPYTDNPKVHRLFLNGERARSWDSHCRNLPGFLAASYRPPHYDSTSGEPVYMDTLGIKSVSYGYTEPAESDLIVSPYGAFPLILASRGDGLAWHRAMLARNKMQSQFGSMDASEAFPLDGHVRAAEIMTWDTKVSSDLAMVGGTTAILRRALQRLDLYDKFMGIVDDQFSKFDVVNGESTPFAPPPVVDGSQAEHLPHCAPN